MPRMGPLGSAPASQVSPPPSPRPVSHQPRSAPVPRDGGHRPLRRPASVCVEVGGVRRERRRRRPGRPDDVDQLDDEVLRPVLARVDRAEVGVVDLDLAAPHRRDAGRRGRVGARRTARSGRPGLLVHAAHGLVERVVAASSRSQESACSAAGELLDVGVACSSDAYIGDRLLAQEPSITPARALGVQGEVGDHVRAGPARQQRRRGQLVAPRASTVRIRAVAEAPGPRGRCS